MSNTQVGTVMSQVISDVVDSSRVDFEEGGVDEHVLELLKLGWQAKLSQLAVASFPWDPKPDPAPVNNPPTVPSNAGNYQTIHTPPIPQQPQHHQQQQMQGGLTMPQQMNNQNGNGPRIKPEPGLESPITAPQQIYAPPSLPQMTAEQRAAQNLHNTYGQRAAASINAIHGHRPPHGQNGPQQSQAQLQQYNMMRQQHAAQMQQQQQQGQGHIQGQVPGHVQGQGQGQPQRQNGPQMTPEQYQRHMAQNTARQIQQVAGQFGHNGGVGGAQTDGSGDSADSYAELSHIDPNGEEMSMGRFEVDGLIRKHVEAMGQRMEGGGLMLALAEASAKGLPVSFSSRRARRDRGIPQGDAADDDDDEKDAVLKDEDVDEDAINSDLDDPDDDRGNDDEEEDGIGNIMLCMYDKVQRVKNKWKCVMKDGCLTINGKEYVFHKATGEYEW